MRSFVRNILPQLQSRSPRPLNRTAEQGLEEEIENEHATVVDGDGFERRSGIKAMEKLGEDGVEGDSDEDYSHGPVDCPSWGRRKPSWSVGPSATSLTADEQQEGSVTANVDEPERDVEKLPMASRSRRTPRALKGLRRIRSAVSVFKPGQHVVPPPHPHSQASSRCSSPGHLQLHFDMTPFNPPPPSPSLRRSRLLDSSHPDITSLVEDWTVSGPANQTLLYKTQSYPNF